MKMVEFKLWFSDSVGLKEMFSILVSLYDDILYNVKWHFFYEGEYVFLRCQDFVELEVEEHLSKEKVKYSWPTKEWKEPFKLTEKYQEQFNFVFWSFSVLVIKLFQHSKITDGLIYVVADRIIHPFLNMATFLQTENDKGFGANWEGEILAKLTTFRAFNNGKIHGWNDAVREINEKAKKDKRRYGGE